MRGASPERCYHPAVPHLDPSQLSIAELRRRLLDEGEPLGAAGSPGARGRRARRRPGGAPGARPAPAAGQAEEQRLQRLLVHERPLWGAGFARLTGVDEAGMGTLAGPVVAAAVILPQGLRPTGLDDSKKLDEPTRERLAAEVKAGAMAWAVGQASPEEVDRLNVYRAGLLAMRRAVEALAVRPDHLLVDARRIPELAIPQLAIVKGDARRAWPSRRPAWWPRPPATPSWWRRSGAGPATASPATRGTGRRSTSRRSSGSAPAPSTGAPTRRSGRPWGASRSRADLLASGVRRPPRPAD